MEADNPWSRPPSGLARFAGEEPMVLPAWPIAAGLGVAVLPIVLFCCIAYEVVPAMIEKPVMLTTIVLGSLAPVTVGGTMFYLAAFAVNRLLGLMRRVRTRAGHTAG